MGQLRDDGRSGAQEYQPMAAEKPRVKKPYLSPSLVEYGSIAKLTESGVASAADGPVGFMMS